jgi:hypothetical protein
MNHKVIGCCTLCGEPIFEVLQVQGEADMFPGEPKQLGRPIGDPTRIAFLLFNGNNCDLSFCEACAISLSTEHYGSLWRTCLASWQREFDKGAKPTDWYPRQFENGILAELGRKWWKELCNG